MAANEGEVIYCFTNYTWTVEFDKAKQSNKLIVIDFYDLYSKSSLEIAPKLDGLAKKFKSSAIFFKVDISENQNAVQEYGVVTIPTVVFIKNGNVVDKLVHPMKETVKATIVKHTSVANA